MDEAVLAEASDISAGWLSRVLGTEVVHLEASKVGTGQMADTVRVVLSYANGATGPDSVIVKVASSDEHSRQASAMLRSYEIETAIYRDLEPLPGVPHCLHAARDDSSDLFTLVLQDLSPCTQGDDVEGADVETATAALRVLARIHARGWGRPDLAERSWLNRQTPEYTTMVTGLATTLAPPFLDRFGPLLSGGHRAFIERLVPKLPAALAPPDGPRTLSHGDFRLDNLLFRPGEGEPWIVDWQVAAWAGPANDVAYFVGGALKPDVRRAHGAELLDAYHAELAAHGVVDYSRRQLEEDLRRASFGGAIMMFGSAILVERTERGDRLFAEMFARFAQQALDLDAESILAAGDDELPRHQPA